MAWIEHRENGWLVRWRDQGKGRSKKFRNEDDAVRFKQTIEDVRLPDTDVRIDEQGYFWAPIRRHEATIIQCSVPSPIVLPSGQVRRTAGTGSPNDRQTPHPGSRMSLPYKATVSGVPGRWRP